MPLLHMYLVAHTAERRLSPGSLLGCVRDVPRRLAVFNAPAGSELAVAAVAAGDDARIQRAAPHWRVLLTIAAPRRRIDARALVRHFWARAARTTRARLELGIRLACVLGLDYALHTDAIVAVLGRAFAPPPPPPPISGGMSGAGAVREDKLLARGGRALLLLDFSNAASLRAWQPPPPAASAPKRKRAAAAAAKQCVSLDRAVHRALQHASSL